jgi:hypothetical protein
MDLLIELLDQAKVQLEQTSTMDVSTLQPLYHQLRDRVIAEHYRKGRSVTQIEREMHLSEFDIGRILREQKVFVHSFGEHAQLYVQMTLDLLTGTKGSELARRHKMPNSRIPDIANKVRWRLLDLLPSDQQRHAPAAYSLQSFREHRLFWEPLLKQALEALSGTEPQPAKPKLDERGRLERNLSMLLDVLSSKNYNHKAVAEKYHMTYSNLKGVCTKLLREMAEDLPTEIRAVNRRAHAGAYLTFFDFVFHDSDRLFWTSQYEAFAKKKLQA